MLKRFGFIPTLKRVSLETYPAPLSLDRLHPGVDNIRIDVRLSPDFTKTAKNLILNLLARQARVEDIFAVGDIRGGRRPGDHFKRRCREISVDGINKAKVAGEPRIDTLTQVAIIKLVLRELPAQYNSLMERFRNVIRGFETSHNQDEAIGWKKKMLTAKSRRDEIVGRAGREIFALITQVQIHDLNEMRRLQFGPRAVIPEEVFTNPMLYVEKPTDDQFTLDTYNLLLGHRVEDPDQYTAIINLIRDILIEIHEKDRKEETPAAFDQNDFLFIRDLEGWLKQPENIDRLINCFHTRYRMSALRKQGERGSLKELRKMGRAQKRRLDFFYRRFEKHGIMDRVVAAYEMQPIYRDYCPPLVPHLVSRFLVSRDIRRGVAHRLKRLRKFYGDSFDLAPLYKRQREMRKIRRRNRKGYLIRFLKDFCRFHRDFQNLQTLNDLMASVNLMADDALLALSKANQTLYEMLLPHEYTVEDKPIVNHVILKADVRGSTEITHRMMERGLNPASHFSLNLFNPITELLPEYGAKKVFVEGDAIILSLFEREDAPDGGYTVSRACGLAADILTIVRRCNERNARYTLPYVEIGIGICYHAGHPAFLFDGDHRIMISSAINKADRLAGCSKMLRNHPPIRRKPFSLYVYQTVSARDAWEPVDDHFLRYNVNGIELNPAGFEKLREEIDLTPFNIDVIGGHEPGSLFYTGKVPLVNGDYRRLVVREARIGEIDPDGMAILGSVSRKYYEICTHPKLYEAAKNQSFSDQSFSK